jgi:hypothetical protein
VLQFVAALAGELMTPRHNLPGRLPGYSGRAEIFVEGNKITAWRVLHLIHLGAALYEAGVLFSSVMGKHLARMLNKSRSGCV